MGVTACNWNAVGKKSKGLGEMFETILQGSWLGEDPGSVPSKQVMEQIAGDLWGAEGPCWSSLW